jgi:hypothetical protein
MIDTNKTVNKLKDYKSILILVGVGVMLLVIGFFLKLIKWGLILFGITFLIIAGVSIYKALTQRAVTNEKVGKMPAT